MKKFLIVDVYNLFYRANFATGNTRSYSIDLGESLCLNTMFLMIKNACDKINPDHLVFCCDGNGTWRKKLYNGYKANRIKQFQKMAPRELERQESLKKVLEEEFIPFLRDKTNVTVLSYSMAEADDLVYTFTKMHPNDLHFILSGDNDFIQLVKDNVFIYNSMHQYLVSNVGVLDMEKNKLLNFTFTDGKIKIDKKKKAEPVAQDWVEYALFFKCIRGDTSDNIPAAYPKISVKSTKNKIGIYEAFMDRNNKGYNWNTFMNSTWKDLLGKNKIVKEEYEKNVKLIDLKSIPNDLEEKLVEYIGSEINKEMNKGVETTFNLTRFLNKWQLMTLLQRISSFSNYFAKAYDNKV